MSGVEKEASDDFNNELDTTAATGPAASIVPIDRGVVHQICSGQVVLSLATAVKELLENSLDAGATVVEIKLKEMGSELVEVSDNGTGVEQRNFNGLTVKHATSKIREFTDLFAVETFGFRGEALSSLCALSTVTISTRHKSSPTGTTMTYDHHGNITSTTTMARPVGTTVTLANLFSTMPVRQKEFQRSLKREFSKLVSVLSAYGLVSAGVRIMVTNNRSKGGKSDVLHTRGSDCLRDNLVNIFGTKQMGSLIPFKQVDLTAEDFEKVGIRLPANSSVPSVKLEGFISSPVHGEGRGAPDRQFYFVNSRPCDPAKLIKIVNQVYHSLNRHQFPFVCLNIVTERETVDINITPDKRQVFLTNEKILTETVKKSLEQMFEDSPNTMEANTFISKQNSMSCTDNVHHEDLKNKENNMSPFNRSDSKFNLANLKRSFSSSFGSSPSQMLSSGKKQKTLQSFFNVGPCGDVKSVVDRDESNDNEIDAVTEVTESPRVEMVNNFKVVLNEFSPVKSTDKVESISYLDGQFSNKNVNEKRKSAGVTVIFDEFSVSKTADSNSTTFTNSKEDKIRINPNSNVLGQSANKTSKSGETLAGCKVIFDEFVSETKSGKSPPKTDVNLDVGVLNGRFDTSDIKINADNREETETPNIIVDDTIEVHDQSSSFKKKEVEVKFNFDMLKDSLGAVKLNEGLKCLKFKAQINPSDNATAEEELKKQIQKSDFVNMKVFGQFNLGFMITGLENDLFIVDQHATDEKYNFETLQKTTVIKTQKMVLPQKLELTSVNESILIDNLPVFEKNGFQFQIDESAPVTQKVKLCGLPISKNWTFGKEDIDELIFMLSEVGGEVLEHFRPSRVRSMFASRACRTSVMVGTSLSMQDMVKLVRHMGEIEQPWNCPHGRPTIRHLVNTELVRLAR